VLRFNIEFSSVESSKYFIAFGVENRSEYFLFECVNIFLSIGVNSWVFFNWETLWWTCSTLRSFVWTCSIRKNILGFNAYWTYHRNAPTGFYSKIFWFFNLSDLPKDWKQTSRKKTLMQSVFFSESSVKHRRERKSRYPQHIATRCRDLSLHPIQSAGYARGIYWNPNRHQRPAALFDQTASQVPGSCWGEADGSLLRWWRPNSERFMEKSNSLCFLQCL